MLCVTLGGETVVLDPDIRTFICRIRGLAPGLGYRHELSQGPSNRKHRIKKWMQMKVHEKEFWDHRKLRNCKRKIILFECTIILPLTRIDCFGLMVCGMKVINSSLHNCLVSSRAPRRPVKPSHLTAALDPPAGSKDQPSWTCISPHLHQYLMCHGERNWVRQKERKRLRDLSTFLWVNKCTSMSPPFFTNALNLPLHSLPLCFLSLIAYLSQHEQKSPFIIPPSSSITSANISVIWLTFFALFLY